MKEDHLHREPMCLTCGRRKQPAGRDAPAAVAGVYCHPMDCDGYNEYPVPSQLFLGETAEPVPDDSILVTRIKYRETWEGQVLAIGSRDTCRQVAEAFPESEIVNDTDRTVLEAELLVLDRDEEGIRDLKRGDRYVVERKLPKEEDGNGD